jgi:hypothetical protein
MDRLAQSDARLSVRSILDDDGKIWKMIGKYGRRIFKNLYLNG